MADVPAKVPAGKGSKDRVKPSRVLLRQHPTESLDNVRSCFSLETASHVNNEVVIALGMSTVTG